MPSIGPLIATYNDVNQLEGATGGVEAAAQSFTLTAGWTVVDVKIQMSKTNSPTDNVLVSIQTNSAGSPSGTDIGTVVSMAASGLQARSVSGGGAGVPWVTFAGLNALIPSTGTYWVFARRSGSGDATNIAVIEGHSGASEYAGGEWKYRFGAAWSSAGGDLSMELVYSEEAPWTPETNADETIRTIAGSRW